MNWALGRRTGAGSSRFIFNCRSYLLAINPVPGPVVMEYALYRPPDYEQRRFESVNRLERRYLSIMFCDLVNSTRLAAEMEPEDLLYLIQAYRHLGTQIISAYNGFTHSFTGDGIMSIFGYPCAHEDDAERATGSALDLIDAIKARKADPDGGNWDRVSVRIGIASGLAVVGNPGVSGAASNRIIVGEPPNLAARIQSAAQPDTVIICGNTRSLVQHTFELKYMGVTSLRGHKSPQILWQATGTGTPQSRSSASGLGRPPAPAGREAEYARLIHLWELAGDRDGRVALVSGEAGAGKTRLLETFRRHVSKDCSGQLVLQCSPDDTNDSLHRALARLLAADGLVSGNFPAGKIPAGKPAAHNPRLIILEDAHHCGMASLALIDKLVTLVRGKPILLAISHRMQRQPPQQWSGQCHVENIHLGPLHRTAARLLIHRLIGAERIPARVISDIISRCDGIPLFLEELTRTALQAQRPATGTPRAIRGEPEIPGKVWTVLLARLDQQHPASREAAQIGAVLGREFSYSLLAEIWPHNRDMLDRALHSLCRSGELLKKGNTANTCYMFKWVLMREVAYQNMPRRIRQNLYRQITGVRRQYLPVRNIHLIQEKNNDKKKY